MPASNDVAGWKRVWESLETLNEPLVKAALKRYEPNIVERMLGGVPVIDIKPKGWKEDGKVLLYAHGGVNTLQSVARSCSQPC